MTIQAVVGIITMPAEAMAKAEPKAGQPLGYQMVSDVFFPNPEDKVDSVATFNVFLQSVDFQGTVSLLKQPMGGEAEKNNIWFKPAEGTPPKAIGDWLVKPGECWCCQVQEPENNVRYCLGFSSTVVGAKIYYRMSL